MPTPKLNDDALLQSLNWIEEHGSGYLAIKVLGKKATGGLGSRTIDHRAQVARLAGMKPTFRKIEKRVYEKEHLGRMHFVIPDVQTKPGVPQEHLEWIGNFIIAKQPDVIVCIGDFADMPSLCSYDKGKAVFEGRRYVHDVKAAHSGMERLLAPIAEYNRSQRVKYTPRMVLTMGNHENRIVRSVNESPELIGRLTLDDLQYKDYGWEVVPFLKPIEIDGIQYCHYFTSGAMGRPVTSAAALLRNQQQSATMGHVQASDIAMNKKTLQRGLFCGICYLHDEDYLNPQDNVARRQIIVKHEVEDGRYDLMEVSLNFLKKAYA